MLDDAANDKPTNDDEILEVARDRFRLAEEAWQPIREQALNDIRFVAGEQWDPALKALREQDKRPCLTVNKLAGSVHQLENDQRQNRPAIKVSPVDDKADVETAKILQGMARHIEYASDADTAYDTAFKFSTRGGFGFFRIYTDYCDPFSFKQELRFGTIKNPFSVYIDPYFKMPDGSDANWSFITEDYSPDEYKAKWPESELASLDDWETLGDTKYAWASGKSVRVAEYFYKEFKTEKLCLILAPDEAGNPTEQTILKSEIPEGLPYQLIDERETLVSTVHWLKINGSEILERTIWPGRWIPVIPVLGDDYDIDGKRVIESLIRQSTDAQRMYNMWTSAETEAIALAPRAPFIGYKGSFKGFEKKWQTANTRNHAYLEVNATDSEKNPLPLPQRNQFEPPVMAITQARLNAADDIKATTGYFDASLGQRSNEQSGIAIQRRNNQSQTASFHFVDNLSKSIRHAGRILVDAMPVVYDTAQAIRILGEDGSEEIVKINEAFNHKGKDITYRLGVGKYDVTVDTGPSFETKRQEAVAAMTELTRAYPPLMQAAGDMFVKAMDIPYATEIAERIKKTMPPGLVDDGKQNPIPPEAQAQMGQMNQMIEMLTKQLNDANEKVNTKTMELESKERIEFAKLEQQATIKLAEMQSNEALALLAHQVGEMNQRLKLLDINQPIEQESGDVGEQPMMPQMQPQQQPPTGGLPPASMGENHEY